MDGDETTHVSSLPRISNPPLGVPDTIPSNPPKAERWRLYRNPQSQETADTDPSGNKREDESSAASPASDTNETNDGESSDDEEDALEFDDGIVVTTSKEEWRYNHAAWNEKFQRLLEYKKEYGTTRVHRRHPILGCWVNKQRVYCKQGDLPEYRRELLNSIGFEWTLRVTTTWIEMYDQLLCYKRQHNGSINVTRRTGDLKLLHWVSAQRKAYSKEKLSQKQIDLMESIGFKWDPYYEQWMEMYQKLVAYNNKYGNTCVPQGCKIDPQLGVWVKKQRKRCKEEYRIDLLNRIGFVWDASSMARWKGRMKCES